MAERLRRASKRSLANRRAVASFTTQLKNETDDRRVRLLCLAMIDRFGGLQQFIAVWLHHYEQSREKNPGGMVAVGFFAAVMRLAEYCEAQQPKPSEMTDEQLHEAAMRQTEMLMRAKPELAVECARRIGWEVSPVVESATQRL